MAYTYYEHSTHPEQTTQEIALRDQIEDIILEFPGYGYRRVTHELARQGWTINHKRVLRVMRSASRCCASSKRNLWLQRPIRVMDFQCIQMS